MVKYLQQLLADIEHAIQMARQLPAQDWMANYEDEDEETALAAAKLFSLSEIYDLPFEAFPPEKLLSDAQVIRLIDSIHQLWSSWRLWWELPPQLSDRQHYSALLHAMQHEVVAWSAVKGGDLKICHYDSGNYCPFEKDSNYCHCRKLDDTIKQDISIWEEHVRSQGLDPYLELSEEEGAAFEEAIRNRNLQKRLGDDWITFGLDDKDFGFAFDHFNDGKKSSEKTDSDEDWTSFFFWGEDDLTDDEQIPENPDDKELDDFSDENSPDLPSF